MADAEAGETTAVVDAPVDTTTGADTRPADSQPADADAGSQAKPAATLPPASEEAINDRLRVESARRRQAEETLAEREKRIAELEAAKPEPEPAKEPEYGTEEWLEKKQREVVQRELDARDAANRQKDFFKTMPDTVMKLSTDTGVEPATLAQEIKAIVADTKYLHGLLVDEQFDAAVSKWMRVNIERISKHMGKAAALRETEAAEAAAAAASANGKGKATSARYTFAQVDAMPNKEFAELPKEVRDAYNDGTLQ